MQGSEGRDEADLTQFVAESFGEVGHLIEGFDALLVKPSQNLDTSIAFFSEGLEEFIEFGRTQVLKVYLV
jgi:hypothetical protein